MAFGPDKNNELSVMMEVYLLILLKYQDGLTVLLEYFDLLVLG